MKPLPLQSGKTIADYNMVGNISFRIEKALHEKFYFHTNVKNAQEKLFRGAHLCLIDERAT